MTRARIEFYLTHYLWNGGFWLKIAEYASDSEEDRDRMEAFIRAASDPVDRLRFERREAIFTRPNAPAL